MSLTIHADEILPVTKLTKETKVVLSELGEDHPRFIVMRNNQPAAVLLSVQSYESLLEELEDAHLLRLALEREQTHPGKRLNEKEAFEGLT